MSTVGGRGGIAACGGLGTVWLSQRIVHQTSGHTPSESLEKQEKETQVKMFAIFAFTVNFTFPGCEMAARTASPSQGV